MQTSSVFEDHRFAQRRDHIGDIADSRGFFTFVCGAVLAGVLIGTLCYCTAGEGFAESMLPVGRDFIRSRLAMDHAQILLRSFLGTSAYLAALFMLGLCAVGQPFEIAVAVFRGMGIGLTMSQLYAVYGRQGMPFSAGLMIPGAVVSSLAVISGVKEAFSLSGIYLRHTLSAEREMGMADIAKLYCAKFFVLEAVVAVSAGIDVLCNYLFIDYFSGR